MGCAPPLQKFLGALLTFRSGNSEIGTDCPDPLQLRNQLIQELHERPYREPASGHPLPGGDIGEVHKRLADLFADDVLNLIHGASLPRRNGIKLLLKGCKAGFIDF